MDSTTTAADDGSYGAGGGRLDEARARTAELAPKMVAYLDRIAPALRRMANLLRAWAIIGAVAAVLNVILVVADTWPLAGTDWILLILIDAALLWAPVAVWIYSAAIRSVSGLPDWLRSSPGVLSANGEKLARIYLDTAGKWGEQGRIGLLGTGVYRAGKVAWCVTREIPEFAMAVRVVNPFLVLISLVGALWIVGMLFLLPVMAAVTAVT